MPPPPLRTTPLGHPGSPVPVISKGPVPSKIGPSSSLQGAQTSEVALSQPNKTESAAPEAHRQRPALPEQLGRHVDVRHVAKHALLESDRLQILDVPSKRHLVVRTAVEIFEQEMRQPRLGQRAIVTDACCPLCQRQVAKLESRR